MATHSGSSELLEEQMLISAYVARQGYGDDGTSARVVCSHDRASVGLNNATANGESQAGSMLLGGKEGFKRLC